MINVEKMSNGKYYCEGVVLEASAVQALVACYDRECYKADVINEIESRYSSFDIKKHAELIEDITDRYESFRGDDDSWTMCLDMAMAEYEESLKEAATSKGPERT